MIISSSIHATAYVAQGIISFIFMAKCIYIYVCMCVYFIYICQFFIHSSVDGYLDCTKLFVALWLNDFAHLEAQVLSDHWKKISVIEKFILQEFLIS